MADGTLHLSGTPELVIRMALVTFRKEVKKAKKKNEELGVETDELDTFEKTAKDLLEQLGYKADGKNLAEVTRPEDNQPELPLGKKLVCGMCNGFRALDGVDCARCLGSGFEPDIDPRSETIHDIDWRCPACGTGQSSQVVRDCELPCALCGRPQGFTVSPEGAALVDWVGGLPTPGTPAAEPEAGTTEGVAAIDPVEAGEAEPAGDVAPEPPVEAASEPAPETAGEPKPLPSNDPATDKVTCGECQAYFTVSKVEGPAQCPSCETWWNVRLDEAGEVVRIIRVSPKLEK